MIRVITYCVAICAASGSWANDFQCVGVLPGWSLVVTDDQSTLTTDQDIEMQVMDQTHAEGRDWPLALTLVGDRDTAILLIENESCRINDQAHSFQAQVLTQRGTTPILLTGCCSVPK